jgi:dolichol-phosphate mannosyltransferase
VGPLPYRASFALLSRRVYTNLVSRCDTRPSLLVEIPRLGFAVTTLPFDKPSRKKGCSKWNLRRKLLALADALVASTYVPLRFMTYFGMLVSGLGFSYAIFLIVRWLAGVQATVEGWTSLMVAVVILSGIQMFMLGIIGEYLWRTKEGTRRDALFLLEDEANLRPETGDARFRPLACTDMSRRI